MMRLVIAIDPVGDETGSSRAASVVTGGLGAGERAGLQR